MTLDEIKSRCNEVGECWIWNSTLSNNGYPIVKVDGRCQLVRRIAYRHKPFAKELAPRQPVVAGCDQRLCVNPACLTASSVAQVSKIAGKAGKLSGLAKSVKIAMSKRKTAKLNMDIARVIRMSTETGPVLAARYGIDKALVNRIKSGGAWKDYSNPFMGLMA
jgi:hypothetical protein